MEGLVYYPFQSRTDMFHTAFESWIGVHFLVASKQQVFGSENCAKNILEYKKMKQWRSENKFII